MNPEINSLLCNIAGCNFNTSVNKTGEDEVSVLYKLDTNGTIYSFVDLTITKVIINRKDNDKVNKTIADFKFEDCNYHCDQLRSWLLFIRYLQSTFGFKVINKYKNEKLLHLKLSVTSNRTCVDDILRAYANVRIEAAKFKDRYLLDEICKIRSSDHFQKV